MSIEIGGQINAAADPKQHCTYYAMCEARNSGQLLTGLNKECLSGLGGGACGLLVRAELEALPLVDEQVDDEPFVTTVIHRYSGSVLVYTCGADKAINPPTRES